MSLLAKMIITAVSLGLLLQSSMGDKKDDESTKPNILFFLIDDQRNDVIGCAGHPFVQTPTINELAANGTRFTNSFVTTSICAASRASIFTGLYETGHNYTFGKDPLKVDLIKKSYPYLLRKDGYKTGFVGKFGIAMELQDSMLAEMFDYIKISPRNSPYFEEYPDGSRRHSAEVKGDQAIEFINQQSNDQRFVYANYYEQEPAYEYLHDLQKDPDQLINFATHPDYKQTLQEMRDLCKLNEVTLSINQKIINYE